MCGRTPTYVFGGSLPHREEVAECLALSGDLWAPELNGADEVTWMVEHSQKNHSTYTEGPRKLAPILNRVNAYAEFMAKNKPAYYEVLLVMLDGPIVDWNDEATEELLRSAGLPLSIVFVAIGDRDIGSIPFEATGDTQLPAKEKLWQVRHNMSFMHYSG